MALYECRHTGDKQRHGDEVARGLQIELQRGTDDQRGCYDGDEDGQQVLQSRKEGAAKGRTVVESVYKVRVLPHVLLLPKFYLTVVEGVHDGEALTADTLSLNDLTSVLECFFDDKSHAHKLRAA